MASKAKHVRTARFTDSTDLKETTVYMDIRAPIYKPEVVTAFMDRVAKKEPLTYDDAVKYFAQFHPANIEKNEATDDFGLLDVYEMLRKEGENYTVIDGVVVTALFYDKDRNGFSAFKGEVYAKEEDKLYLKDKNGYIFVLPLQNNTVWMFA